MAVTLQRKLLNWAIRTTQSLYRSMLEYRILGVLKLPYGEQTKYLNIVVNLSSATYPVRKIEKNKLAFRKTTA